MNFAIYQVDAFTSLSFRGNPAGVCILEETKSADWMQQVAAEMNLSETAFVDLADQSITIRYFTPTVEVPLCGHATLSSAHILWAGDYVPADQAIEFKSRSGKLHATREKGWIVLDFPIDLYEKAPLPPGVADSLSVAVKESVKTKYCGYLLELESEPAVRELSPNLPELQRLGMDEMIVTAPGNPDNDWDFVSRFFGPGVGIPEDPVTGAAHCSLAPYWSKRLGRTEMTGYQASARGGVVKVRLQEERVDIMGQACTVFSGQLQV